MDFYRIRARIRAGPAYCRDHGHEENLKKSYEMPDRSSYLLLAGKAFRRQAGCAVDYVWETGGLFLATKKALESKTQITINGSFSV